MGKKYFWIDGEEVVVVMNDEKQNELKGYWEGVDFVERKRKKGVSIDDVKIEDLNWVKWMDVRESYIEK